MVAAFPSLCISGNVLKAAKKVGTVIKLNTARTTGVSCKQAENLNV